MAKINPDIETFARIKVIGLGGSGKNAINHMINSKVKGVEFIVMNTDTQDLHNSLAEKKIHIGKNLTKGLGAGMNPDVGKRAAEETKSEIQDVIKGADMVFIACGMGGGTGTGSAPIVARAAKEQGVLTVGVVTKPFFFEGAQRMRLAEQGLAELEKEVDAIIVIPNDRLLAIAGKDMGFKDAFTLCDDVLRQAVEGISELITRPGEVNVDFADIKTIMHDTGTALMGLGRASGDNRAEQAAMQAINSPLLDVSINGAKGVLFAISGGDDITFNEVQRAATIVTESIDKEARVIWGMVPDDRLKKGEMQVTVIATGFPMADGTVKKSSSLFMQQPIVSAPAQSDAVSGKKSINDEKREEKREDKRDDKREINHAPLNANSGEYVKKIDRTEKPEIIDETDAESFDDDLDEWNAIPAFLRRKKQ
ncbi:MAG: cell division protein FtsZ [Candidatus Pacebacteria bacterium]|nr:cell division protein FtsZ [Candidatus Paceibacterota bacterium]MBP9852193.1 cell division protein FtsZ [Candidatus Paceibacterota bacterium]